MLTITNPQTFDWSSLSLSDCCEGNAKDAYFTYKLYKVLSKKAKDLGVDNVLDNLIFKLIPHFVSIELEGLLVSEENLKNVETQIKDELDLIEATIYKFKKVPNNKNIDSNDELGEILYTTEGGFECYPYKYTDTNSPSVDEESISNVIEIVEKELSKRG